MKSIPNKFAGTPGYICFGCSPDNDAGLKLTFFDDNGTMVSVWKPDQRFTGYNNIIHGGIQATIIDETAAWAMDIYHGKTVVTTNLNVNYLKPLKLTESDVTARAVIQQINEKNAEVFVELLRSDGIIAASGTVQFRIVPERLTAKLLNS